ncbi:MAG: 3'-5' exonuclease [Rhodospirillales bacterium]
MPDAGATIIAVTLLVLIVVLAMRRRTERQGEEEKNQNARDLRPILPERFVVFDFETTGLDCNKHEILEIGAISVNRDGVDHKTFQCLVIPQKRISRKITEITGIDKKMVTESGQPLADAISQFRDFIGDLPLVAYNAEFDMGFLHAAEKSLGLPKTKNEVSCALELARRAWPSRRSYKLSELAKDGRLDASNAHRALDDCKMTMIVYAAASSITGRRR